MDKRHRLTERWIHQLFSEIDEKEICRPFNRNSKAISVGWTRKYQFQLSYERKIPLDNTQINERHFGHNNRNIVDKNNTKEQKKNDFAFIGQLSMNFVWCFICWPTSPLAFDLPSSQPNCRLFFIHWILWFANTRTLSHSILEKKILITRTFLTYRNDSMLLEGTQDMTSTCHNFPFRVVRNNFFSTNKIDDENISADIKYKLSLLFFLATSQPLDDVFSPLDIERKTHGVRV